MLIDLQTSFPFSLPPLLSLLPFFISLSPFSLSLSPGPVSPYKNSPSTKERTRPATLNPITIDQWALRAEGGKCAYLNTHAQICLDAESPIRSEMMCVHS